MSGGSWLVARAIRRLRVARTRARFRAGHETLDPGEIRLAPAFRHPFGSQDPKVLAAQYRAAFPEAAEREIDEARRLIAHRFRFLGHETSHGPVIAWSLDPVSGSEWSHDFSPAIRYRGVARLGDIKLPWELAKHQYFFTLGKAGALTGDPAYAREIIAQITHWMDGNPSHRGIHWISALETGTRVVSWTLAYPFITGECDARFRDRLARSIGQHLLFVEQNLSIGRFTNTHLAGEAAVLVIGGLFVQCRHSRRWIGTGLRILADEIHRQVRKDGVHSEQSIAYHRFFLDQYYLVQAFLKCNAREFPDGVARRVERMTEFLLDVVYPDGTSPAFGDCDDARGIWLRADCPADYRSLLALGAVVFRRGDFKYAARAPTEELLWLHGAPSLSEFAGIAPAQPAHTSRSYPDAGYLIMRSGWDDADSVLVYDCGPLGHGPSGHGHADALSFQLFTQGHAFLTDAGTYSYNLDYTLRDEFRSTRAHNTIVVDNLSQSEARDRMAWSHIARSRLKLWTATRWFDLADGEHDGYQRLQDPVTHRRIVIFVKPCTWIVQDLLNGRASHELESWVHVAPDCRIELCSGNGSAALITSPNGSRLCIATLDTGAGAVALELVRAGSDDSGRCWHSPGYGWKVPGQGLRIRRPFARATSLLTVIRADTCDEVAARHFDGFLRVLPAGRSTRSWNLLYRTAESGIYKEDALLFDGRLLFMDRAPGDATIVHAADFHRLTIAGVLDVRSTTAIEQLALDPDATCLVIRASTAKSLKVVAPPGLRVSVNGASHPFTQSRVAGP